MSNVEIPILVILDEVDADRILRMLYNGIRPLHIHTLICLCGASGDLRKDINAWNGWQILPHAKCPTCIENSGVTVLCNLFPQHARQRFQELLREEKQ